MHRLIVHKKTKNMNIENKWISISCQILCEDQLILSPGECKHNIHPIIDSPSHSSHTIQTSTSWFWAHGTEVGSGYQWVNEAQVGGLWTRGGSSELTPAVLRSGSALWNEAICLRRAALGQHPSACQKIGPLFKPDVQKQERRIPILPLSLHVCLSFCLAFILDSVLFRHCIFLIPPSTPFSCPMVAEHPAHFSGRASSSLAVCPSLIPRLDVGTAGRLNRCSPLSDFSAFELILSAQLLKQLSPPAASHFRLDLTHSASLRQSSMTYTHSHRPWPIVMDTKQSAHTRTYSDAYAQRKHLGTSVYLKVKLMLKHCL